MQKLKTSLLLALLLVVVGVSLLTSGITKPVGAQQVSPSPSVSLSPTPMPTPGAHLTFRTCLIPNTTTFRLFFRADYVAGEYRVVGQNTGYILNIGYLDVGQTGGGFGNDNTTYVLPYEDVWIKQWHNGTRWQRAGGLPETNVAQHVQNGYMCEMGSNTYYTPTPLPTSNNAGIGGVETLSLSQTALAITSPSPSTLVNPSPSPNIIASVATSENGIGGGNMVASVLGESTDVLGVTTLAETGQAVFYGPFLLGFVIALEGFRRLKQI